MCSQCCQKRVESTDTDSKLKLVFNFMIVIIASQKIISNNKFECNLCCIEINFEPNSIDQKFVKKWVIELRKNRPQNPCTLIDLNYWAVLDLGHWNWRPLNSSTWLFFFDTIHYYLDWWMWSFCYCKIKWYILWPALSL